ncbi:Prosaposin Proactivator polypeptide [Collichthys lucidus]|uniref:Prosaposin Proactivator polypeptide n=1 Tax=Collichthys lucidus TaxID=240159 RepID=A0A4U5VER6_COLLU|nr:Prosaposin Proactivator polypeptide [Collichthys lucidus]
MTMSPAISIALLLLSATVAKSWESPENETEEEEDDSSAELNHDMKERADHDAEEILQDQAFPGSCYACRYIVSRVKRQAGRDHSKARIRCLMMGVCNGFRSRFVRSACKKVTRRCCSHTFNWPEPNQNFNLDIISYPQPKFRLMISGESARSKSISATTIDECKVTSKLKTVCNEIGLLKAKCIKFVNGRFGELVEELTTTDDVRTICVNLKACKPKELLDLDFDNDEDPEMKTTKQPTKRSVVKSWVSLEGQTEEEEDSSSHDMRERAAHHTEKDEAFPGSCTACKLIVSRVKRHLGKENTKAKIRGLLAKACNRIRRRFIRSICKKLVRKYQDKLINTIANKGTPRSICIRLSLCKRRFWTVHGRNLKVSDDDQEGAELDVSVGASRLPGYCWVCKWSLNKVKKRLGRNATVESVKEKLMKVCDEMGLLKSLCRKFMRGHLGVLIEELSTTDDVRTICVNLKACKPKELLELDFESDEDAHTEMNDLLLSLNDLLLE